MADKRSGRPAFNPSATQRRSVEELASCGTSHDVIARAIGCSRPTLRKNFADELANGGARRRMEVIGMLFRSGRRGNVQALRCLEELTREARVKAAPPLGKKAERDLRAQNAERGTEWETLLERLN